MRIPFKTFKLFISILIIFTLSRKVEAQLEPLTFEVRTSGFVLYDSLTFTNPLLTGLYNVVKFDLYIQQTNIPQNDAEIMRFALGQYFWNLNYGNGLSISDTAGGYATLKYVPGSTTFSNINALPTTLKFVGMNEADDTANAGGYPTGSQRSSLKMNSNVVLGNNSDVQISSVYPGTKVGTYIFKKNSGHFPVISSHMRWRKTLPNPYTKIFCYNGLGGFNTEVTEKGTYIMDTLNAFPNQTYPYLKLSAIPQGFYNSSAKRLNKKDFVTVFLRQSVSPYSVIDSASGLIDSINFRGIFYFLNAVPGSYYLDVRHYNCIETWSSNPVTISPDSSFYDFTESSNKAYGDNLKLVDTSPLRYGLYSGDLNHDGIIDGSDISFIENDAFFGVTGNVLTDLTGDRFVDAEDLAVADNNTFYGIIKITP